MCIKEYRDDDTPLHIFNHQTKQAVPNMRLTFSWCILPTCSGKHLVSACFGQVVSGLTVAGFTFERELLSNF